MKAVVLLSGGLDSVVNFKCALDDGEVLKAITCDYGQAAFQDEKASAAACAGRYGVPHEAVDLGWYRKLIPAPIAGSGGLRPVARHELAEGGRRLLEETWVPNRNAVLVAVGAAYAEHLRADLVVAGFNAEEAQLYPDNSAEFLKRANAALELSTLSGVRAGSYTLELDKTQIVALGVRNGAPLDLVYSCYGKSRGGLMCGLCQSCARLKASLEANGLLAGFSRRFAA